MAEEVRLLSTAAAAIRCGKSQSWIRRKLVPASMATVQSYYGGDRISYYYALDDLEAVLAGRPVAEREHPDPSVKRSLQSRAARGLQTRGHGEAVAEAAKSLEVVAPARMPTCCKRHARNWVRHEGSKYDALIAGMRSKAGYQAVRDEVDAGVDFAIGDRMPEVDYCGGPNPHHL